MLAVILSSSALALTPPVGWHASGGSRAVLDRHHPEYGEVREYILGSEGCSPTELAARLREDNLAAYSVEQEQTGEVNLGFPERVGRARCATTDQGALWVVVLAGPSFASALDPDALLTSLLPVPTLPQWGDVEAEVLSGGHDGTPWGEHTVAETKKEWWGDEKEGAGWDQNPALVGSWDGSTFLRGKACRVRLRFEETGNYEVELKDQGETRLYSGEWHTHKGTLQLHSPGDSSLIEYSIRGSTLNLVNYRQANITLYKQ